MTPPLRICRLRTAQLCAWDADRDWASSHLVVVRTPWDYVERRGEFLSWAARVTAVTQLANPLAVLRWNSHKGDLLDLAQRGVPSVATHLVRQGAVAQGLAALAAMGAEVVVKPAVGSGARGARRGVPSDPALAHHLSELAGDGDVLVQPFVPAVTETGETSLVFIDNALSHAVCKVPERGDYRVQASHGGRTRVHDPSPEEVRVARAALAAAPGPCLYGRVDLVAGTAGPLVMELEVLEPELFLNVSPGAAQRLADAIVVLARRAPACPWGAPGAEQRLSSRVSALVPARSISPIGVGPSSRRRTPRAPADGRGVPVAAFRRDVHDGGAVL